MISLPLRFQQLSTIQFWRNLWRDTSPTLGSGGRCRSARRSLVWFLLAALLLHAGAILVLDELRPGARDPEYARRVRQLRARLAENPRRPLVLVIGSSRSAMGICPAEWEAVRPNSPNNRDPVIFNMSLLGGGPVMELLTLRRIYTDGVRPELVLLEYWPPYLHWEGGWAEPGRIAPDRLYPVDRPIVREYFPDPARTERLMRTYRWNPFFAARNRLLVQLAPKWLPNTKRLDWTWDTVDSWGWKPGFDYPPGLTEQRTQLLGTCRETYRPLFTGFQLSRDADRAIRQAVAEARAHGSRVGFVYLPEASEFRSWYPPRVEQMVQDHLAALSRELAVPVLDARLWMDDGWFVDGFHLSRIGARVFTRKFGPAVAAFCREVRP